MQRMGRIAHNAAQEVCDARLWLPFLNRWPWPAAEVLRWMPVQLWCTAMAIHCASANTQGSRCHSIFPISNEVVRVATHEENCVAPRWYGRKQAVCVLPLARGQTRANGTDAQPNIFSIFVETCTRTHECSRTSYCVYNCCQDKSLDKAETVLVSSFCCASLTLGNSYSSGSSVRTDGRPKGHSLDAISCMSGDP